MHYVKGEYVVTFISKLGIESKGIFAAFIFYAATGMTLLALLPLTYFAPQLGIIGIFSLIVAYGLFKRRTWTMWPIMILLFTVTAFSVSLLYYSLLKDVLSSLGTVAYLVLTWVFTAHAVSKREKLEA